MFLRLHDSGGECWVDTMLLDDRCIMEVIAFDPVDIPICSWEPFSP